MNTTRCKLDRYLKMVAIFNLGVNNKLSFSEMFNDILKGLKEVKTTWVNSTFIVFRKSLIRHSLISGNNQQQKDQSLYLRSITCFRTRFNTLNRTNVQIDEF